MIVTTQLLLILLTSALFVAWQISTDRIVKSIFAFAFMMTFLFCVT